MSAWDRMKVVCVFLGIGAIVDGILEGFFSIRVLEGVFDSRLLFALYCIVFWLAAPWIGKFVRVGQKLKSPSDQ